MRFLLALFVALHIANAATPREQLVNESCVTMLQYWEDPRLLTKETRARFGDFNEGLLLASALPFEQMKSQFRAACLFENSAILITYVRMLSRAENNCALDLNFADCVEAAN